MSIFEILRDIILAGIGLMFLLQKREDSRTRLSRIVGVVLLILVVADVVIAFARGSVR